MYSTPTSIRETTGNLNTNTVNYGKYGKLRETKENYGKLLKTTLNYGKLQKTTGNYGFL